MKSQKVSFKIAIRLFKNYTRNTIKRVTGVLGKILYYISFSRKGFRFIKRSKEYAISTVKGCWELFECYSCSFIAGEAF